MVFNDAVVHQRHTAGLEWRVAFVHTRAGTGAVAEMGVRVVHRRRAVRGPAGVGDAGAAFDVVGLHLVHQLRHTRSAARALQAPRAAVQAGRVHGHTARVITPVFEPLQALHEDGNDVAG